MIGKNTINLCTLNHVNVNGMHNEQKAWRVIEFIKRNKCHVSFLQETHLDIKLQNKLNQNSNFDVFASNGTTSSRGVAILIDKFKVNYEIVSKFSDEDGRLLLLEGLGLRRIRI